MKEPLNIIPQSVSWFSEQQKINQQQSGTLTLQSTKITPTLKKSDNYHHKSCSELQINTHAAST